MAVAQRSRRSPTATDPVVDEVLDAGAEDVEASPSGDLDTSVGKALALLEAFRTTCRPMGVTELARLAHLPKSTAYRLLAILRQWNLVERSGSDYCLGKHLFELGNLVPYCQPRGLRDVALPYLMRLYEASHETVHLAVLDGTDVLYIEKIYGHNPCKAPTYVGGRMPVECAALGKAMLAFSDKEAVLRVLSRGLQRVSPYTIVQPQHFVDQLGTIRQEGVAFDREESTIGLTCVAAPVLGPGGKAIAAVSLVGPTYRFKPDEFAGRVREAAVGIAQDFQAVN